eukprot:CAMPEP_0173304526 /NCGR_PEP_ID=MMETSP1143-20121109/19489_1 /TAXON_ID=483371 /ORGANISM="non described non described, Strain CCMP2298" /LENGTH=89 /DNA_ID=CAMNT_0014245347 /DNA_START=288 /DNA_END=554 /DNA_ORIENTATION=-
MAFHIKDMKQAAGRSYAQLKEDMADIFNKTSTLPYIIRDLRQNTILIDTIPVTFRRVYVLSRDSHALCHTGWVLNEGVESCINCQGHFN